jgi:hypothetical protein
MRMSCAREIQVNILGLSLKVDRAAA